MYTLIQVYISFGKITYDLMYIMYISRYHTYHPDIIQIMYIRAYNVDILGVSCAHSYVGKSFLVVAS